MFIRYPKDKLRKYFNPLKNKKIIDIPVGVKSIGEDAFYRRLEIEEVRLPSGVTSINKQAFAMCKNLLKINIPETVTHMERGIFLNCVNLIETNLPSNLTSIPPALFYRCAKLKEIKLPENLELIENMAFSECSSLANITFPESLERIGEEAFSRCYSLKEIDLGEKIKSIEPKCFYNCDSLTSVSFPGVLEKIGEEAFRNCLKIESVEIPDSVKIIDRYAFGGNQSLKSVCIPDSYESLSYSAFSNCPNISTFRLGDNNMTKINDFMGVNNCLYSEILFMADCVLDEKCFYNMDINHRFDMVPISNSIIVSTMFSPKDLAKKKELACLLPFIIRATITKDNYKRVKHELWNNDKEFTNLLKKVNKTNNIFNNYSNRYTCYSLYKFARLLGAFNDDKIERQRACEFISNLLDKNVLTVRLLHDVLFQLENLEYNSELAEFLMDKKNIYELLSDEQYQEGYIARICNSFEKIRMFGRSNKGNQRYKKVTPKMCEEYFFSGDFEGVDEKNKKIARTIRKFTRNQGTFDLAKEVMEEYDEMKKKGQIDDHILQEELFSKIDSVREESLNDVAETLDGLNMVANRNFSYEFLAKSDPLNFVLGKYCSCCAHLEGLGAGIVKASILHPDCQNLIIRDKTGKVVAKSTLYVNRSQGYGLFNNVEIDEGLDEGMNIYIYKKYKQAVADFAEKYNKLNPLTPIKQINVGMNLNDLTEQIKEYDEIAEINLKMVDFNKYGNYDADCKKDQAVIWKKK